jgi:parallel beta-helix repeat protein
MRSQRILSLILSLSLCLLALVIMLSQVGNPARALSSTRYVATTGTDFGNCTDPGNPCRTVQYAVDVAGHQDFIKVATGIYSGVQGRPAPPGYDGSSVITQVVYISKTVAILGGYTTDFTEPPDPIASPTTLDAEQQGRVLFVTGAISPTVEGLYITGGDATGLGGTPETPWGDAGGGVYVISATVTIRDNQVFSNTAPAFGGGLDLLTSNATLDRNSVLFNTAQRGGGLFLFSGDAMLSRNTIASNTASHSGGGMYAYRSIVMLDENTVSANSAGFGGGLRLWESDAVVSRNEVISNTAYAGGGIELALSDAILTNNVVTDNNAQTTGSGLQIRGSSPQLLHTTVARNYGGGGSAIDITSLEEAHSSVALTNTILASHTVGISVTGGNSVTFNGVLWHSTPITVSMAPAASVVAQNQYEGDPSFTSDGYHIDPASAAMNAGVDAGVPIDIDGYHRPYGPAPDLGADEIIGLSIPPDVRVTLAYTDTQGNPTMVQVPAGAVPYTTTLVYVPVATATPPPGFFSPGPAFDLDAYRDGEPLPGFAFSLPVTITIHYSEADVAGLEEGTLLLLYWNGSTWEDAACRPYDRHPAENWLAVPICHLSRFALFGEAPYGIYLPIVLRNAL